jgi:hypothetical protein
VYKNLPANRKQGPVVPEEMYQTLLTNNKQEIMRLDLSIPVKIFEIYLVTQSL